MFNLASYSNKILFQNRRSLAIGVFLIPLSTHAIDVELKGGDFKNSNPWQTYHVYDGTLNLNGSISSPGEVRNYATWSIAYESAQECRNSEKSIIEPDGDGDGDGDDEIRTCDDNKEFAFDSGYTHSYLNNPQSSLNIGKAGVTITGPNGGSSDWEWNVNAHYKIILFSKSTFSDDKAERKIQYMGRTRIQAVSDKADNATLDNTFDKTLTGLRKATLYFFPANSNDYKLKDCSVNVNADYGTITVPTQLSFNTVHYLSGNSGAFVSFKLDDLSQSSGLNSDQIQSLVVTPTCYFENLPGTLGTLSESDSISFKLDPKEIVKTKIVTVVKTIERPEIDNLFGVSQRGTSSHHIKIEGNVVKLFDNEAKANGFDLADHFTYYLSSSSSDKPGQWKTVENLGGEVKISDDKRKFQIKNVPADKLLSGAEDRAWIKVSARSADGQIIESLPHLIKFRLSDNVDIAFNEPAGATMTQNKEQVNICINSSHTQDSLSLQLNVRESLDVSKIIFDFNDIDNFKLISFTSGPTALIGSQGFNREIAISPEDIHDTYVELKPGKLTRGNYNLTFPIKFTPHNDSVFINATLWGTVLKSPSDEITKLDAHDITYSYSPKYCH